MNSPILSVFLLLVSSSLAFAQARSAYLESGGTSAVDVKGKRYNDANYPGRLPPWMLDRIKSVAPDYPYRERALHHSGRGYFRLMLDPKTGAVTQVLVQKSTGFATLDNCAIAALRRWRWKPGRWREIFTPVTFRLSNTEPPLPPGSVRLPLR
jgi:TonB family protein